MDTTDMKVLLINSDYNGLVSFSELGEHPEDNTAYSIHRLHRTEVVLYE